ncbi:hypothetical protein TEA_016631 [Camellia sinensis var. sinensis]|uniref:PUM-HD domain-containing protein n=1 Tax=Camellia sinensis var. sinensis TaxID=542762 RepID=A0A4S4DUG7_CAMSN|nr:hypothetical protein TEA_016631 [Camellia sinensis var. sinensis]
MAAKRQGSTESKKRKKFSAKEPEDGEKSNPKRVKFSSNHLNKGPKQPFKSSKHEGGKSKLPLSHPNKGPKEPFKSSEHEGEKSNPKKVKLSSTHPKKPFKSSKQQPFKLKPQFAKSEAGGEKNVLKTKRELRLEAKELAEARKKKRKPHYTLEQHVWKPQYLIELFTHAQLVSEAIQKMKGKIPEIASSHVSSRVLQTCVKYCSQAERDVVFAELRPHFLTLACNTYAVHLVKKMLDNASKNQLAEFISFLHGHVASLLRHMVGSVVVEHAYQSGNATQKQALLMELYSTELQLFKDLVSMKESRLVDVISKLGLQKASVLRYMSSLFQPILEKGIVDHSIIHKALMEYFSIADKASAADVIQQLSGPLLVRMIHTREGSRIAMLCIKHGSAKERKKIIKGMKGHVGKIAHDQFGSMVLACILSIVDDTKLVTKVVIRELQTMLKELVLEKNGRRPLLQLLHPNYPRYFSPDDLGESDLNSDSDKKKKTLEVGKDGEENSGTEDVIAESNKSTTSGESTDLIDGGKKDHLVRRQELLVNSGLAESLIDACVESAGELLGSNFGKEIIYEVATGGAGGILLSTLDTNLDALHRAIASLVAESKLEDSEEEHLLENFHSSRTIRRLVLDCPAFASILWKKALKGKSEMWAQGHSSRVVCAFLESSDSVVRELAKKELQPLIDSGVLKLPEKKLSAKED